MTLFHSVDGERGQTHRQLQKRVVGAVGPKGTVAASQTWGYRTYGWLHGLATFSPTCLAAIQKKMQGRRKTRIYILKNREQLVVV